VFMPLMCVALQVTECEGSYLSRVPADRSQSGLGVQLGLWPEMCPNGAIRARLELLLKSGGGVSLGSVACLQLVCPPDQPCPPGA